MDCVPPGAPDYAPRLEPWTRRRFLRGAGSVGLTAAGLALLGACGTRRGPDVPSAADGPPETTTIRLMLAPSVCLTPQYVAGTLLRDEGFDRVDWKDIPYGRWRDYDPEDTLRFYALRLHEVGMVKSNPNAIVERGTDWRFLNDLKRELKG